MPRPPDQSRAPDHAESVPERMQLLRVAGRITAVIVVFGVLAMHGAGVGHGMTMRMTSAPGAPLAHEHRMAADESAQTAPVAMSSAADIVAMCIATLTFGVSLLVLVLRFRRRAHPWPSSPKASVSAAISLRCRARPGPEIAISLRC